MACGGVCCGISRLSRALCTMGKSAAPDFSKRRVFPLLPPRETLDEIKWPLERVGLCVLWVLLLFCPFWWWIDWRQARRPKSREERWDERRANWVLGWVAVLLALWLFNPGPTDLRVAFAVLAGVRLLEVFTTGLGTALQEEQQVRARNLVTIAFYFIQITLIFAILYHCLATTNFVPDTDAPIDSRATVGTRLPLHQLVQYHVAWQRCLCPSGRHGALPRSADHDFGASSARCSARFRNRRGLGEAQSCSQARRILSTNRFHLRF